MGQPDPMTAQGAPMDSLLAQWRRERPDLDPSPMAVCGEVWRAGERLRQGVVANIADADLDPAGFDVLLTLRRQGRGNALSPSALAKDMMLSTSAMTNRLDRLEKRGLIARQTDPDDRRGLRIVLTDAGFTLVDGLVASHLATEARMLAALSAKEREQLRRLLTKIGGTAS
ncbi:MarR family winged helix-turn-helix transcriptional regulator [Ralstonia pseudosolanacearum]|uniref:MarR family transcriptional regulator n=1 Tax=Ralstonia solanacearum TaxID=305 RepID=A0AA92K3V6_RALSL|nr:MarR family transcriptional regulator [Ralstonia pseudosolanacearum]QOK93106.1 MarR family transcriptional regulator [Ralstonia pseudosolanacearum]QOK98000.1 MarR family transcriptional regulator [Ralstonia pseudosolanacearum]UWD90806.1 MarR family transcriptional regulator [Ralstonia pseudosolanacearum]CAH0442953.1 Transcriptional regulator SlyA [Ralstonia pseudosolanacearum]